MALPNRKTGCRMPHWMISDSETTLDLTPQAEHVQTKSLTDSSVSFSEESTIVASGRDTRFVQFEMKPGQNVSMS